MHLIDTHSHIYSEEFDDDREDVIARAEAAGVEMILLPAIDSSSHVRQEALAASRPYLFRQMMGLHPTSVNENYEVELAIVHEKLFRDNAPLNGQELNNIYTTHQLINSSTHQLINYVAIGEIGLDFYWDTTYREQQIEALKRQLLWAEELGLPVVLHLRSGKDGTSETDAYKAMFSLCRDRERYNGIMHCFSGSIEDARRAVEMGFLLGIGGVVTYKKSALPDIVREIPLESLVLETDAPYLAPVPYRGRRNESAYVRLVAEKVAEIKGISVEEVDEVTTANALALIGEYN
ncbi:MAG: TatD family hydrolase [Prevotella sp.]|nr:TatD family hydrolase [Prevotella sp.]